ncbi:spindle apparatus coiled-coil protein 1 spindly isoform X2 [Bombus vancouverensis nearcticus]|uniref:Protein Spindly isoform X1 n=1 Tax=Bombus bifarius TaxID=103933 RepID=A0A6P8N550_9HYME|nr:protein Spindly isoform X1 [Bombus bifarius]
MFTQDSMNEGCNEEYMEDSEILNQSRSYNVLKAEYEKCRQENHDLKRKLRVNEAMLREVHEANEILEHSHDQQISEKKQYILKVDEKHRTLTKEYENTILNLETKLEQQAEEIEKLRQRADQCIKTECEAVIVDQFANLSFETDNISLKKRVDELLSILQEERKKYEYAEESIAELKSRCDHYEHYTRSIKEQLAEKDQTLEEIRAELSLKRTELESLQMDPTCKSRKGNSIFAEVEDRRQNVMNKMNVLREKYMELKRICKSQIMEIKKLRTERVATLRKLDNDADHTFIENEELIKKYKSRISDLENKLKIEIKKNSNSKQLNCSDTSFRYFQSLVDTQKKEMEELRIKVEDLCTKLLMQEETKMNITKQLHYWRYKASSLEVQMYAAQAELRLDLMNDAEHEVSNVLKDVTHKAEHEDSNVLKDLTHKYNTGATIDEKQSTSNQRIKSSAHALPLNYSLEIEHTGCLVENPEEYKTHIQLTDKENSNNTSSDIEVKIITPKRSCKFEHNQSTNNDENKPFHSVENTAIKKSKVSPSTTEHEYPVVYISTNFND